MRPSWTHRRRVDGEAARAHHQPALKREIFPRLVRPRLGPQADHAIAQPALERAQRLPFQAIDRIARRMALRDRRAGELPAGVVVMAIGAGEVQLTLPALVEIGSFRPQGRKPRIARRRDRLAARLQGDIGAERQQAVAFGGKRVGLLARRAAEIDPALEIDRLAGFRSDRRIARRHALHAGRRIAVTVGTGFSGGAGLFRPRRRAGLNEQHRRVGGVVVLHLLQGRAHVLVARAAAISLRQREGGREHRDQNGRQPQARHVTVISTWWAATKPSSPLQRKAMMPLSLATAENETNGLAAIAGDIFMRKISRPFQVALKSSMILRGMMRPLVPGRKPVSMTCMISALISTTWPFFAVLGALTSTLAIR